MAFSPLTYGPKIAAPGLNRPAGWTDYMVMSHVDVNTMAARLAGWRSVTEPISDVAGATGDGTTNDYAAIQARLDAINTAGGGTLYFPGPATYLTNTMLAVPATVSIWLDPTASIKAGAAMEAVLQTPLATKAEDRFIRGGKILCNALANVGIDLQYAQSYYVTETCVEDWLVAAYRLGSTGAAAASYECRLYNAHAHRRTATVVANSIGLHIRNATDCMVTNFIPVGGETGVQIDSGCSANMFVNVHPWVRTGLMKYGFNDSGRGNMFVDCYADSPSIYAFWLQGSYTRLVNCLHYNNPDKLLDNTPIAVRFEAATATGSVTGLFCWGGDNTHRIAKDFEFAGTSTGVTITGTQWINTVTMLTQQTGTALAVNGALTSTSSIIASGIMSGRGTIRSYDAASSNRDYSWQTSSGGAGTGDRWTARCTSTAESGSNAGSDFQFFARDDSAVAQTPTWTATRSTGVFSFGRGSARARATITYSASMTPDAAAGDVQTITVTNGTAFTVNAPTNPTSGQTLKLIIKNTSGGAMGAITWNAAFKVGGYTSPATANNRFIDFYYDGTNWIQVGTAAADVPN